MMSFRYRLISWAFAGFVLTYWASNAAAHFLWLKTIEHEGKPHAFLFFGESPDDEAYHLPEPLAKVKIWSRGPGDQRSPLKTASLETDERVGIVGGIDASESQLLEASETYGIYGKSLLTYYTKHISNASAAELDALGKSGRLKLDIVPSAKNGKFTFTVLWDGKPLEGSNLVIRIGEADPIDKKTDAKGQVELKLEGDGLISVLANYIEKAKGKHNDKDYESVMHYASLTLGQPADTERDETSKPTAEPAANDSQSGLTPLPEPVSSFGAAVSDGWLYVYGGHTGGEHEHSVANLSQFFRRLKLAEGSTWEELPMQTRLQGLALVAHDGKVYRVGGLNARNATKDDEEDLHSTDEFAVFDPATGAWKALASLPAPRSSHNAVVIDGKLYVVGGWHLHGKSPGDWQADALVYDFAKPEAGWNKLPAPPFKRRAIAIGNWHGKLVAIGGMDDKGHVSRHVDIFDPQTGKWSEGPKIPGSGLMGFGGSACDINGEMYVTGLQGFVYKLDKTGSAWEKATRMATGRFFHQLVPTTEGRLLVVGGASRKDHLADIESIEISANERSL